MSTENPYASSRYSTAPPPPTGQLKIGLHVERGLQAFTTQWQAWLVLTFVAGLIYVIGFVLCVLPGFLVAGPLAAALYIAAFFALDGRPIGLELLSRGLDSASRTIPAALAILAMMIGPMLILYVLMNLVMLGAFASGAFPQPGPRGPGGSGPPPAIFVFMIVTMVGFYGGLALTLVWNMYIGVKTMFVLPLIIDRNMGVREAFRTSWDASRGRFWWLLLFNILAGLIMQVGLFACYIGMIATFPIGLCILASGYREVFPPTGEATVVE